MKKVILSVLMVLLASSAWAGTKPCTTQMVTANICRAESNVVLYFDAPLAFWASMAVEICASQGYQETVDDGAGNQIPNPQSCGAFSQAWLRSVFLNLEKSGRARTAAEVARDAVLAEPDADVGDS